MKIVRLSSTLMYLTDLNACAYKTQFCSAFKFNSASLSDDKFL